MQPQLLSPIDAMTPDDLRTHLRNAYGNTTAQAREIEMLHRLRASMAAEIANKTRMRDEVEATTRKVVLQRDELLAALESICAHASCAWAALDHNYHEALAGDLSDAIDQARVVVAKAKGRDHATTAD